MAGPPLLPRVDLPVAGTLTIDLYGDLHVGSPAFDQARFLADLAGTIADPSHYLVLNGDLLDLSNKHQKHGGVYEQHLAPDAALDRLVEWLTPARDKILAITSGNHDNYAFAAVGIDPIAQLAARLGLADRYLRHGGFLWTRHGRAEGSNDRAGRPRGIEYVGFLSHGTGSGPSSTAAERVARSFHADWYALAHTHTPLATGELYYQVYPQTGTVVAHTKRVAVSGSYLDYAGYALEKRLVPRPTGKGAVRLADGQKRVEICLP